MGRAPCCDKNGLKKGPWTLEEDNKLVTYIQTHGPGNWRTLPKNAGLERCGKSCRLRWTNYLRPDIKRGRFSFEEEEAIIQLHSVLGNKWSAIAARLPGRTDNEIKNYWNTHIRKRLLRNGIDPVTHTPRLDLMDLSSFLGSSLCNPSLLNLTNLLRTQVLLNPELLRLASTILALKNYNSDLPSPILPENPSLSPTTSPFPYQPPQQMQECNNTGDLLTDVSGMSDPVPKQGSGAPTILRQDYYFPELNFGRCSNGSDPSFPCELNNMCETRQCFGIDLLLSMPISGSTPLNSSSTLVDSSPEEEKGHSYSSNNFLDFEIPESFEIGDFI
ncbi:hypothetical protein MLD38_003073 [Melastoma candidum]|uniref:Uncharacterized protein n=1 Tax=Melastoma candidum TaxID=119954 RepID=A0ACB9S4K2_9MYRT|nr:hypothetical protein MLD38_003073 [Melastoma candidum]